MEIKEILVPVDFSGVSLAALEFAKLVAEKFGAELHLVHIDDDPILNAPTTSDNYREQQMQLSLDKLHALLPQADRERLMPVFAVRAGCATVELLNYIEKYGVDLVVMGSKGRSALSTMLLGSVAEDLMRKAPCPVVTVRKPEQQAP